VLYFQSHVDTAPTTETHYHLDDDQDNVAFIPMHQYQLLQALMVNSMLQYLLHVCIPISFNYN
jgi:hypothetical protein